MHKFPFFKTLLCISWFFFLTACASSYRALELNADFNEKVAEAKRITDNPRAYVVSAQDEVLLIAALNYSNPYASEQPPVAPVNNELNNQQQYEQALRRYEERQRQGNEGAAAIRQASVLLLGRNPTTSTFELLAQMVFDSNANVRQEALQVILRANDTTIPILLALANNNNLNENERSVITQKLATFGRPGEAALIELLGSFDAVTADYAAAALYGLYPYYPNSRLDILATSANAEDRFKAAIWLGKYQNEQALYSLLLLTEDEDIYTRERSVDIFNNMGRWVINPCLLYLRSNSFPKSRELIITKLAENSVIQGIPYLYELFASSNPDTVTAAAGFAAKYGISFLSEAQKLFKNPNPQVRLAAVRFASNYNDSDTITQALPLLTDTDVRVRAAAGNLITKSFPSSEVILRQYLSPQRDSPADRFILNIFTENGATLFLFTSGSTDAYRFDIVNYLLYRVSDAAAWQSYLAKIKNSKIQLDLNSFRNLWLNAMQYRSSERGYLASPLVNEAMQVVDMAVEAERLSRNEQRHLQQASDGDIRAVRLAKSRMLQQMQLWRSRAAEASAANREHYNNFYTMQTNLFNSYLNVAIENRALAERILQNYSVSLERLRTFVTLNLRLN
jgi:HEAT repeat protein